MALAGLVRPLSPATDAEFERIFGLIRSSASPEDSVRFKPYAPPSSFVAPPVRVEQRESREPSFGEGRIHCWVEGRIFNVAELAERHNLPALQGSPRSSGGPAELLAKAEDAGCLEAVLRDANGEFCAVLFDLQSRRLTLCTDRLGLRPLYFQHDGSNLFFCTQLRGILGAEGFTPRLETGTAACFLDLGHLLGDRTWFDGVELLSPATILRFETTTGSVTRTRHWRWSTIAPATEGLGSSGDDREVGEELTRLLRQAVARRVLPGDRISVLLSGGLDSRALLACLPRGVCQGTATLGVAGCRDILYAERAARVAGVPHRTLLLTSSNWSQNRFHALWKCDGMSGLAELCSSQYSREMRALGTVNLNGFAGDLVAGGSYLKPGFLDVPAGPEFARLLYGPHALHSNWAPEADDYSRAAHTDAYVLAQRVRRSTLAGNQEAEGAAEQRKPFMDNDLIEFLYGLSDVRRQNGTLYRRALCRQWPDLFENIPWQKTGLPLDTQDRPFGRARIRAQRVMQRFGWSSVPAEFQDFPRWLPASAAHLRPLIEGKDAVWPTFVPPEYHDRFNWNAQLASRGERRLLNALSLEVWLRQVFHGTHRHPDVSESGTA